MLDQGQLAGVGAGNWKCPQFVPAGLKAKVLPEEKLKVLALLEGKKRSLPAAPARLSLRLTPHARRPLSPCRMGAGHKRPSCLACLGENALHLSAVGRR